MSSLPGRALGGAAAGIVATAVMSAHMLGAPSLERIGTPPPQRIADRLLPAETPATRQAAAVGVHLAIGAASGLAYGVGCRRRGPLGGALFGVAVWAVGYQVVVPLVSDLPPARHDPSDRTVALLQAHLVFGAVLGLLSRSRG